MQGLQSFRFDIPLLGPTIFNVCKRKQYRLPLTDPENKEPREGRWPQKGEVGWPLPSPSPCQAHTPFHHCSPAPSLDLLLDRDSMGKAARQLQRMTGMLTVRGGHHFLRLLQMGKAHQETPLMGCLGILVTLSSNSKGDLRAILFPLLDGFLLVPIGLLTNEKHGILKYMNRS